MRECAPDAAIAMRCCIACGAATACCVLNTAAIGFDIGIAGGATFDSDACAHTRASTSDTLAIPNAAGHQSARRHRSSGQRSRHPADSFAFRGGSKPDGGAASGGSRGELASGLVPARSERDALSHRRLSRTSTARHGRPSRGLAVLSIWAARDPIWRVARDLIWAARR